MNPALKFYIEQTIIPIYLQFDPSHSPEHVHQVIQNSLEIADGLNVNLDMVYTVAAYHDIGMLYGRKNHETKSRSIVLCDLALSQFFSRSQILLIGDAVEDHRASLTTEPRSIYGKIIAEADRDLYFQRILTRTLTYAITVKGIDDFDELLQEAYTYIANKYVTNRCFHLWLTYPKNSQGLAEITQQIHDPYAFEESFTLIYQKIKQEGL